MLDLTSLPAQNVRDRLLFRPFGLFCLRTRESQNLLRDSLIVTKFMLAQTAIAQQRFRSRPLF